MDQVTKIARQFYRVLTVEQKKKLPKNLSAEKFLELLNIYISKILKENKTKK